MAQEKLQTQQKQIPVEKLLMQYGKINIQLTVAEEELTQAQAIITMLQNQVNQLREALAKAQVVPGAATDGEGTEAAPAAS